MTPPVLVMPPAAFPVSLSEIRQHTRAPSAADEDNLLQSYLAAATAYVERVLERALITQTWRQDFDAFDDELRLPIAPVQSVTTIAYYDADEADQMLSTSVWELRSDQLGPFVALRSGQSWPVTFGRLDAVRITFVAGYGNASDVPGPIRQAIRLMAAHWDEHRSGKMFDGVDPMLESYRRMAV